MVDQTKAKTESYVSYINATTAFSHIMIHNFGILHTQFYFC